MFSRYFLSMKNLIEHKQVGWYFVKINIFVLIFAIVFAYFVWVLVNNNYF